jgi:hypothetical protein
MGYPISNNPHGIELRSPQYTNLCSRDFTTKLMLVFPVHSKWTNFKPPAAAGAPVSVVAHPLVPGDGNSDVVFTANILEYVSLNCPVSAVQHTGIPIPTTPKAVRYDWHNKCLTPSSMFIHSLLSFRQLHTFPLLENAEVPSQSTSVSRKSSKNYLALSATNPSFPFYCHCSILGSPSKRKAPTVPVSESAKKQPCKSLSNVRKDAQTLKGKATTNPAVLPKVDDHDVFDHDSSSAISFVEDDMSPLPPICQSGHKNKQ